MIDLGVVGLGICIALASDFVLAWLVMSAWNMHVFPFDDVWIPSTFEMSSLRVQRPQVLRRRSPSAW